MIISTRTTASVPSGAAPEPAASAHREVGTEPYCFVCGTIQFLRHLDGCEAWQVPVIVGGQPEAGGH